MSRRHDEQMRAEAIQRVLARAMDRATISSLGDLRRAYEDELAAHGDEIGAQVDAFLVREKEILARALTGLVAEQVRCPVCDNPITDAKRLSRRYCSNRFRQRAHRARRGRGGT